MLLVGFPAPEKTTLLNTTADISDLLHMCPISHSDELMTFGLVG